MNRKGLSESFNKAAQTLEESTDSARKMLESLQQDGKLLIAPRKEPIMIDFHTMNLHYYVLSILRKDGTVSYLQKGAYSAFSIKYGSFKTAIQFETIEEIKEIISSHPEFTKRIVYSNGSSAPPSVIWDGLDICKDTPRRKRMVCDTEGAS